MDLALAWGHIRLRADGNYPLIENTSFHSKRQMSESVSMNTLSVHCDLPQTDATVKYSALHIDL